VQKPVIELRAAIDGKFFSSSALDGAQKPLHVPGLRCGLSVEKSSIHLEF
jgi:hypothetical protein